MSGSPVAIGLDLGTSGIEAVAVDTAGVLVGAATAPYPLLTPRPGWTEQRPEDWWRAAGDALRELGRALADSEVLALGASGQMHGMVALDADDRVIRPALLWNDQRTAAAVLEIEAAVPRATLIERGGNPAITGFQLAKLLWLRQAEPEAYARLRHVAFPKDYLTSRLTGRYVSEPSDASGSNCFAIAAKTWDREVLDALDIDVAMFPEIVPSTALVGAITRSASDATGLPEGLPVVAGAGDNAAAATGLGITSTTPELGSVSLGTSGVLFAPVQGATPDPHGRVHLFCHADGGYYLLGVTLAAAGSLRWLRDTLFEGWSYDALIDLAAGSEVGAAGVTFLPFLAGERTPYMDADLRGSWQGLSLASGRPELVRSLLEGVAFSLRSALDVMRPLAPLNRALATGGGSRSAPWSQLLCDALGLPLSRLAGAPGAAYGAALLALRGIGIDVVPRLERIGDLEPADDAALARAYTRYRALAPAL